MRQLRVHEKRGPYLLVARFRESRSTHLIGPFESSWLLMTGLFLLRRAPKLRERRVLRPQAGRGEAAAREGRDCAVLRVRSGAVHGGYAEGLEGIGGR